MKQILGKEDYEKYSLKIPFAKAGKGLRSYIFHELEKLHPGFDDTTCFDYSFKLKHWSLMAEIFVADRLLLESQGFNFAKGLYLEGQNKKRFFVNRNQKRNLLLIFFAASLLALFCCYGKLKKTNVKEDTAFLEMEKTEEEVPFVNMKELLCDLLLLVEEKNARVANIKFDLNSFNVSVKGLFPEDAKNLLRKEEGLLFYCSNVMYNSALPEFNLEVKRKKILMNDDLCDETKFYAFRNLLLENSAELQSEDVSRMQLNFLLHKKYFSKCLTQMEEYLCRENLALSEMSLSVNGTLMAFSLCLSCKSQEEFSLIQLADLKDLFFGKEKIEKKEMSVLENNKSNFSEQNQKEKNLLENPVSEKSQFEKSQEKDLVNEKLFNGQNSENQNEENADDFFTGDYKIKLGSVSLSDGKIILFYKNSEGKIKGFTK